MNGQTHDLPIGFLWGDADVEELRLPPGRRGIAGGAT